MIKKDKKLFITLILLCVIVLALVFFFWLCEDRSENSLKAESSIDILTKENIKLEKENKKLLKEIEELEEEISVLEENLSPSSSSLVTYQQSMIDLSDISLLIKEGKISEAKKELLKINTNGFDFTALSFYESLCRELNINAK